MKRLTFLALLFVVMAWATHADGWIVVQVNEGRFTVSFPAEPVSESLAIETVFGSTILTVHAVNAGKSAFFAGYYDIPGNVQFSEAELLDAERDRGLKGASASLVQEEAFKSTGYSGRLIIADKGELRVRTRNFMLGRRLYSLVAVGPMEAGMEAAASKFFESVTVWLPEERCE